MQRLLDAAYAKRFGTIHKHKSYFREYNFCITHLKDKSVRVLEIGVSKGGSLGMWQQYFKNADVIVGLDIDTECRQYERDNLRIYIGDQTDRSLLERISRECGPFDLIVDDGGHTMQQQIISFETLFPLLADDGVYVIEDLHTSYWPRFKDYGMRTMIRFLKDRIDDVNFWAKEHPRASQFLWFREKRNGLMGRLGKHIEFEHTPKPKNEWQRSIRSIYIADSIAFVFKGETDHYSSYEF